MSFQFLTFDLFAAMSSLVEAFTIWQSKFSSFSARVIKCHSSLFQSKNSLQQIRNFKDYSGTHTAETLDTTMVQINAKYSKKYLLNCQTYRKNHSLELQLYVQCQAQCSKNLNYCWWVLAAEPDKAAITRITQMPGKSFTSSFQYLPRHRFNGPL